MKTKHKLGNVFAYVGNVFMTYSEVELTTIQPERMEEITIRKTSAVGRTESIYDDLNKE